MNILFILFHTVSAALLYRRTHPDHGVRVQLQDVEELTIKDAEEGWIPAESSVCAVIVPFAPEASSSAPSSSSAALVAAEEPVADAPLPVADSHHETRGRKRKEWQEQATEFVSNGLTLRAAAKQHIANKRLLTQSLTTSAIETQRTPSALRPP